MEAFSRSLMFATTFSCGKRLDGLDPYVLSLINKLSKNDLVLSVRPLQFLQSNAMLGKWSIVELAQMEALDTGQIRNILIR